jgi:hypothetical protein
MLIRRIRERLRKPDAELARDLRRYSALTVLSFLCGAVVLFLLHALSLSAPHPLSLFVGHLARWTAVLFRVLAAAAAAVLAVLLVLQVFVHAALRKRAP